MLIKECYLKTIFYLLIALLISICITSCAVDPAPPGIHITIKTDSSIFVNKCQISGDSTFQKPEKHNEIYSQDFNKSIRVSTHSNYFKIKATLNDSTSIYSQTINIKNKNCDYSVLISKDGFQFETDYSIFISRQIKIFLIILLISFCGKTIIFLFKFDIKNKFLYSVKYSIINTIVLFILEYIASESRISPYSIYLLSLGLSNTADITLHNFDKNIIQHSFLTIILANCFFYTILIIPIIYIFLLF